MAHAAASSIDTVSLMCIRLQYEEEERVSRILEQKTNQGWNIYELSRLYGAGEEVMKYLAETFPVLIETDEEECTKGSEKEKYLWGTRRKFGR